MHPIRGRPIPIRCCSTKSRRARRCFDALVSGRIGSVAELASLEGIGDRMTRDFSVRSAVALFK
jgi:hypothetical protein